MPYIDLSSFIANYQHVFGDCLNEEVGVRIFNMLTDRARVKPMLN